MTEDHSARSQGADHATDNASTSKENGDRAGVYDIKLHTSPVSPIANRPTRLLLVVTKLAAHDPIREFDLVHDRLMHLIVVSEDLAFFDHVHPELGNGVFRLAYRFRKPVRTGSGPTRSRKAAAEPWSRSAWRSRAGRFIDPWLSFQIGKGRRS